MLNKARNKILELILQWLSIARLFRKCCLVIWCSHGARENFLGIALQRPDTLVIIRHRHLWQVLHKSFRHVNKVFIFRLWSQWLATVKPLASSDACVKILDTWHFTTNPKVISVPRHHPRELRFQGQTFQIRDVGSNDFDGVMSKGETWWNNWLLVFSEMIFSLHVPMFFEGSMIQQNTKKRHFEWCSSKSDVLLCICFGTMKSDII